MCNKKIINEVNDLLIKYKQSKKKDPFITDLSYLKTYTIDDLNTLEIDDAVSIEKISNQYKLWIHIASSTSYIEYDSEINKKAKKLMSTIYLSKNTIYMLPEILINKIFSLNDKDKRESLSLGVILNEDGSVASYEIVQSLIKVNYRLSYTEADELIDYAPIEEEDLSIISTILQNRKHWRKNHGAKEILESYGKIIVEDNTPTVKLVDPTFSRQLISEAMILYGDIISNFTKKNKIPIPYRVQNQSNKINNKIKDSENIVLNNFLYKRDMGKTYYSINPMIHSSLGLRSYTHATSPIRRYADMLVHYQLNRYFNNRDLLSSEEVEKTIYSINKIGKQNIMRQREDQKIWQFRWFKNNISQEYKVILLNWINRYKNICILYLIEYKFSTICNLNSKLDLNMGDTFNVKNITHEYNDLIYFQLI